VGAVPRFPVEMEQHINAFLQNNATDTTAITEVIASPTKQYGSLRVP
jgi:hypothetical protein